MNRRVADLLIVLLVPAVLAGVALHQMWLTTTSDLTPWKGGGFGMFSSVDRPSHRAVRGLFHTDQGVVPVDMCSLKDELGRSAEKTFINARALPDARRMDPWAELVMDAGWRVDHNDVAVFAEWQADAEEPVPLLAVAGSDGRTVTELTIEVWAASYDREGNEIAPALLTEHRYPVETGP